MAPLLHVAPARSSARSSLQLFLCRKATLGLLKTEGPLILRSKRATPVPNAIATKLQPRPNSRLSACHSTAAASENPEIGFAAAIGGAAAGEFGSVCFERAPPPQEVTESDSAGWAAGAGGAAAGVVETDAGVDGTGAVGASAVGAGAPG